MAKDLAQILTHKIVLDSSVQRFPSSVRLHCCFIAALGLDEAKCHDRMGREGQSQPVTLGLEGRQYYGLSMKPAPWVHVLKSVPSHLGDALISILDSNSLCY